METLAYDPALISAVIKADFFPASISALRCALWERSENIDANFSDCYNSIPFDYHQNQDRSMGRS